jgi:hypothetical protein
MLSVALLLSTAVSATMLLPAGAAAALGAVQPAPASSAWPQKASIGGATYILNAPAYTGISGNTVSMRSTVQVDAGKGNPVDGTLDMSAVISQASDPGYVELGSFQVTGCEMTDGSGDATRSAVAGLLEGMAIEAMLTTIVQGIAVDSSRDVTGLSNPVPAIRVVERPAVLVSVNGKPVLGNCAAGWQRVVNTPSILLKSPDGAWYSRVGGSTWLSARDLSGPFAPAEPPPAEVTALVGAKPPPPAGTQAPAAPAGNAQRAVPDVVVALVPTLLVSINGAPALAPACDGVERVTNAAVPLLRSGGTWWTLGSGRWYSTADLANGPWSFVPAADVPAAFAGLPAEGQLAPARASVPGTLEAKSAAVASSIVRAVTVQRSGSSCAVRFRGEPAFAPIEGGLEFASNATQPVIRTGGELYCCDNGAWFSSRSASGPWKVCDSVPSAIYSIPPSSPVYACTYVEVMASTPESVTFGCTPGYMGTYMQGGTPVYGTGYDYNATNPQPVDQDAANVASYVAPSYPSTYGNQAEYSYGSGTYAPEQDYGWSYGYADMYPSVYGGGYGGWGWSPYWGSAFGYGCGWGYGYGWGYGGWGNWNRGWHDRGDLNRALNNRGVDGNRAAGAAANRWSNARAGQGARGAEGVRGGEGQRAGAGSRPGEGMGGNRGMDGYHRPGGAESVSGFRPAEGSRYGGYRGGGGMRSGGGARGGGRR